MTRGWEREGERERETETEREREKETEKEGSKRARARERARERKREKTRDTVRKAGDSTRSERTPRRCTGMAEAYDRLCLAAWSMGKEQRAQGPYT